MGATLKEVRLDEEQAGWPRALCDDLAYLRTGIVNLFLYGPPGGGDRSWVLIDAGLFGSSSAIIAVANRRFGRGARPSAIILTHGHFDHVGGLPALAELWDVPVYAHELELPYLTGRSSYPPPDPSVGGGAMAYLSWMYPRGPIDLGNRARRLPSDGTVPGMPGWRWIATPGHSPGHVSLYRDEDRTLIAGDAFVTVKQESLFAVLAQQPVVHGPPAYFTCDWESARESVQELAALKPRLVATGHGIPLRGAVMIDALRELADDFNELGVPSHGRYVPEPAVTDVQGVVSVPPDVSDPLQPLVFGFAAGILGGIVVGALAAAGRHRRA